MSIEMQQFYQVFFDESEELLAQMESILVNIAPGNANDEDLNAIFRAAHSIKGGAGTFGFTDLTEVTHVLESLLDRIRKHELALSTVHIDAFLEAKDILALMVSCHRQGVSYEENRTKTVMNVLQQLALQASVSPSVSKQLRQDVSSKHKVFDIKFLSVSNEDYTLLSAELSRYGKVTQREDENLKVLRVNTTESRVELESTCAFVVDVETFEIHEVEETVIVYDTGDGYGFFKPLNPIVVEEGDGYGFFVPVGSNRKDGARNPINQNSALHTTENKVQANENHASMRVSIDKVDDLINLVGELVITEAMIEACLTSLDPTKHAKLIERVAQLTRNTRHLQESVMSIRMMPMDYVFSRFPRMVRDLANKLDKQVELVTHGASTELDKSLIEKIIDPLTHLIRNSIDHGIELPDERTACGKNPIGKITLSASHAGGHIVIEVSDDGAGLNKDKILDKARKQNLRLPENPTDNDVWNMIFEPGFSTADVVTDVSGRGVGMDVVKRNIQAMGGSVSVQTAIGFGTTLSISVPLTLAILDGMTVRIGHEKYILPLNCVIESVQPANVETNTIQGKAKVINIRGQYLPVISLRDFFGVQQQNDDVAQAMYVIVESNNNRGILIVDELVGQQQVVVKNLEANYRKVPGISGATILGDGSVSLIIDVNAIINDSASTISEGA